MLNQKKKNRLKDKKYFLLRSEAFEPAYLALYRSGELKERVDRAIAGLAECHVCPRDCGIDRLAGEAAVCKLGRRAMVSSCFPHFGEEDCLRGWNGSGTIFFSMCNLRCVFCQNYDISQSRGGLEVSAKQLASMMIELENRGCHNINFVTPEHVVPQVLEALLIAAGQGLKLPIVYNTSAYDSMDSLRLLDGIVDIYMPDFKIWGERESLRYLKAKDYPEAARQAVKEMHRQVGPLKMDERGLAKRGVLIRHLVMPGEVAGSKRIMEFLSSEVSTDTFINIMDQYRPAHKVSGVKYQEIKRRITSQELQQVMENAREAGLWRFDERQPRWLY